MVVYEKTDFEAYKNKEDICPKNYIAQLYFFKGDLTYMVIFPVHLRMDLIFPEFPIGNGSPLCAVLEICKYLMHP